MLDTTLPWIMWIPRKSGKNSTCFWLLNKSAGICSLFCAVVQTNSVDRLEHIGAQEAATLATCSILQLNVHVAAAEGSSHQPQ